MGQWVDGMIILSSDGPISIDKDLKQCEQPTVSPNHSQSIKKYIEPADGRTTLTLTYHPPYCIVAYWI